MKYAGHGALGGSLTLVHNHIFPFVLRSMIYLKLCNSAEPLVDHVPAF